ncbi:Hypothetical predicted protein, partial [Pelobates cultripes]
PRKKRRSGAYHATPEHDLAAVLGGFMLSGISGERLTPQTEHASTMGRRSQKSPSDTPSGARDIGAQFQWLSQPKMATPGSITAMEAPLAIHRPKHPR